MSALLPAFPARAGEAKTQVSSYSPKPPPADTVGKKPLSFEAAIDMAVASSLMRREAEADQEAQTARYHQALADLGPRAVLAGAAENYDKKVNFFGGPILVRSDKSRTGSLAIRQPLSGLYSAWQHSSLEKTQEEIAQLGVEQARIDAAFAAAEAYRRTQEAAEKQRIAEASIAATESQLRDARELVETGRLIKSDLLKIEIAKQEAKAALARAVATRRKALANLAYVLNVPDANDLALEPLPSTAASSRAIAETNKTIALQATDLKATLEKASTSRIDLKQANLGVTASEYAQRLVDWKFAPEVNAFVSWDRIYDTPPFGMPPFTRTYGVQASWEIWDNGSRVFARHEAAAKAQHAELMVQATKDKLLLELQSVLADLQAAKDSLAAAQATVTQAEDAYRMDKSRFSSGLVTATDLVLSETAQTRARGDLVTALTEVDVLNLMTQKVMGEVRPHALLH